MDNQERYNELAKEIKRNNNLYEPERLEFYRLHKTIPKPDERILFNDLFELGFMPLLKYQENVKYKFSGTEEEIYIIGFLEERIKMHGLTRDLYELLVYLANKNSISTIVNSPTIPKIVELGFNLFKTKFNYTDRRGYLFQTLEKFLDHYSSSYKLSPVDILVGGGFIDSKDSPQDIDLILIMEYKVFRDNKKFSKLKNWVSQQKRPTDIKPPLDIMKLPINFDLGSFLAYQQLTMIGNGVLEKQTNEIKNIIYFDRVVYKTLYKNEKM